MNYLISFLLIIGFLYIYIKYAKSSIFFSNPNRRSLHEIPVPHSGGIIFSSIFLVGYYFQSFPVFNSDLFNPLFYGGIFISFAGLIDDLIDVRAFYKLLMQFFAAVYILYWFDFRPIFTLGLGPYSPDLIFSILALVWFMNIYNFMDGSDGMAISGAIFMCCALLLVCSLSNSSLIPVIFLLLVCCLAFLVFNYPPALVFMGDSGSLFLGFAFCALITKSVVNSEISIWTWIIIYAYFAGETTLTTVARIFLVKDWYKPHRSNAYQNVVRLSGSHKGILILINIFHFLWILPLAVLSVIEPKYTFALVILAYLPVCFFSARLGPRLSSC